MRRILLAIAATIVFGCTPDQRTPTPPTTSSVRVIVTDSNVHLVGVAGPLGGQYAAFGRQLLEGANAAIADINRAGGVLGKPLRVHAADDGCDPKRAVAAANAIALRGAVLVAGHFCSAASINASSAYLNSNAVMISPASTSHWLTSQAAARGWRHVLRTAPNEERQGDVAAHWLIRNHRGKRIALVHDESSYGQRIAAAAQRRLEAAGVRPAHVERIRRSAGAGDELIARLVAADPEAMFFAGYQEDAAALLRRLRAAGSRAVFLGTDALVDVDFWRMAGAAGQGARVMFLADPRRHPSAQSVVAQFKARGIDPEGYILPSYAAVQVWAEAARRAGSVERDRVATELRNGSFETVLGTLTFDAAGDLVDPPYTLYVWNDGSYRQAPDG